MDAEQQAAVETFRELMHEVVLNVRENRAWRTPLGDLAAEHLRSEVWSFHC